MKRKGTTLLIAMTIVCSILFSSCIGSFSLSNKLLDWNRSIDSKFVNELVFIAFWIVPVYEISCLADVLVINSIEFWSGTNPVADVGTIKKVDTDNGVYTVETKTDGYHIEKEGEKPVDFVYNQEDNSWNVEVEGESTKLLRYTSDDEVVMYLPDGREMPVQLNQAGVWAFQQVVNSSIYYANK